MAQKTPGTEHNIHRQGTRRIVALLGALFAVFTGVVTGFAPTPTSAQTTPPPAVNALRYNRNGVGDFKLVGNTVLTCSTIGYSPAPTTFACATVQGSAETANQTRVNDHTHMVHIDQDGSATPATAATFNSSDATLSIPAGHTLDKAYLYWGGNLGPKCYLNADPAFVAPPDGTKANKVKVSIGGGAYVEVTAGTMYTLTDTQNNNQGEVYQAMYDLTSSLPTTGTLSLRVANVQTGQGRNCHGGWALAATYFNGGAVCDPVSSNYRSVTLYDGLLLQRQNSVATSTTLSGFLTSGGSARVGVLAWEGDQNLAGDKLQIDPPGLGNETLVGEPRLTGNPQDNFFASTVDGAAGPTYANNLGIDAKTATLPGGAIPANASSVDVSFFTDQDTYLPGMFAFSTPVQCLIDVNKNQAVNGSAVPLGAIPDVGPGDEITYTVTIAAQSSVDIEKVVVRDLVPAGTTFKSGSLKVASNTKTNAENDDTAALSGGEAVFHVGASAGNAPGGQGGTISPLSGGLCPAPKVCTTNVSFTVTVNNGLPDGYLIENQAAAFYQPQGGTGSPLEELTNIVKARVALIPNIAVDKTASPLSVNAGETVTYTFNVTNTGKIPLNPVTIADPKCDAATLVLVTKNGDTTATTLDPDLNPATGYQGDTWQYRCTRVAQESDAPTLVNIVTVTGTPTSGSVPSVQSTDTATVTVTVLRTLTITKNLVGGPVPQTFNFSYNCTGTGVGTGTMSGSRSIVVSATPPSSGVATVPGVPVGSDCTVTEAANTNYTTTVSPAGGLVEMNLSNVGNNAVTFTNTFKTGTLRIEKTQVGGANTDTFSFSYNCGTGFTGTRTIDPPSTGSGFVEISGMPPTNSCTVTEVDDSRYTTEWSTTQPPTSPVWTVGLTTASVTPGQGTATVKFRNTRKTGTLTINKTRIGGLTTDVFNFSATCAGQSAKTATVTGSGPATIANIWSGTTCSVTETAVTGYTTEWALASAGPWTAGSTIPAASVTVPTSGVSVWFRNTRQTGTLRIAKIKQGGPTGTFNFSFNCGSGQTGSRAITVSTDGTAVNSDVTGIMSGSTCTVTEVLDTAQAADYTTQISPAGAGLTSGSVTVIAGGTSPVTFTNLYRRGSLKITKDRVGGQADTFTFNYNCGTGYTGTRTLAPVAGTGTQSASTTIDLIPAGAVCAVTETANPLYDTTVTPSTGQITIVQSVATEVKFTNTRKTGTLQITKVRNGGLATDSFTIGYSCTLTGYSTITGSVTITDAGTQNVAMESGRSCTVTETAPTGWAAPVISPATAVSITAGGTASVTVTNTRNSGTLRIKKDKVGGPSAIFSFTYDCGSGQTGTRDISLVAGTVSGTSDVTGLMAGSVCTVTETAIAGYSTNPTSRVATATMVSGQTVQVLFTNTFITGGFRITKNRVGGSSSDIFTFTYTCTDGKTGTITITGSGTSTINGVTPGATCTVTETADTRYNTTVSPADPGGNTLKSGPVTIVANSTTPLVTFTNDRKDGRIVISKIRTGGNDTTFTFNYACDSGQNGSRTVTVSSSGTGTATISNVYLGANCTITEIVGDNYTTTPGTATATVGTDGQNITVTFTNVRKVGTLKINKIRNGGSVSDVFTFNYNCGSGAQTGTRTITGSGSVDVTNIWSNQTCVVTEATAAGYTTTVSPAGGSVTITEGATSEVTFTNYHQVGSLKITKERVGGSAGDSFTVHYDCGAGFINDITLTPVVVGSVIEASQTIPFIPNGRTCVVTEPTVPAIYELTSITPSSATIATNTTVEVRVKNTRKAGTLKITKNVVTGDITDTFNFNFNCGAGAGQSGTRTITGSNSVNVTGIWHGASCTVTETAIANYVTTYSGTPATVNDGQVSEVIVTNTGKPGTLQIVKVRDGGPATDEFTFRYDCGPGHVGVRTVTGSGNAPAVTGIPGGSSCTVTEDPDSKYTTEVAPSGTVAVGPNETKTVTFTNTRKKSTLKINAVRSGGLTTDSFDYSWSCTHPTAVTASGSTTITPTDGTASDTVSTTIVDGSTCSVIQSPASGYTTTRTPTTGQVVMVAGATSEVTYTNSRDSGILRIKKVRHGGSDSDTFTFDYNCGTGYIGTVEITNSGNVDVPGIPAGRDCDVDERENTLYQLTDVEPGGGSVQIENGVTKEVRFTNTRKKGSLRINKTRVGGSASDVFTFEYNCGNGIEGTKTITGSGSADVQDIYGGSVCTVTEQPAANYNMTVAPASSEVTIAAGERSEITFTNVSTIATTTTTCPPGLMPGQHANGVPLPGFRYTPPSSTTPGVTTTVATSNSSTTTTVPSAGSPSGGSGSVRGVAYLDDNGNGRQDGSEGGLAGMTVQLHSSSGTSQVVRTSATGDFVFGQLGAGDYEVSVISGLQAAAVTTQGAATNTVSITAEVQSAVLEMGYAKASVTDAVMASYQPVKVPASGSAGSSGFPVIPALAFAGGVGVLAVLAARRKIF